MAEAYSGTSDLTLCLMPCLQTCAQGVKKGRRIKVLVNPFGGKVSRERLSANPAADSGDEGERESYIHAEGGTNTQACWLHARCRM